MISADSCSEINDFEVLRGVPRGVPKAISADSCSEIAVFRWPKVQMVGIDSPAAFRAEGLGRVGRGPQRGLYIIIFNVYIYKEGHT